MFLIFKIIPDWFWWLLLIAGLSGYFLSYLPLLKPYAFILKIVGSITTAASIFIFGMLYCDNAWKQTATELQTKVDVAEAQSQVVNSEIKEKVVVRTQLIKTRGADVIQYVDREVVKYDNSCVIPKEFIDAHNRAAEQPK
jgi:uncharacterized membrane protein